MCRKIYPKICPQAACFIKHPIEWIALRWIALLVIDLLRMISVGSGTGMSTGSEAGIGSGIVLFLVFVETFYMCSKRFFG